MQFAPPGVFMEFFSFVLRSGTWNLKIFRRMRLRLSGLWGNWAEEEFAGSAFPFHWGYKLTPLCGVKRRVAIFSFLIKSSF